MPTRDQWYEELCRLAVAEHFGVPLGSVVSTHLEGRTFAGAPPLRHQIDLYVEVIANDVAKLDIVVDAKWRGIGIRIEDDILITQDGFENLTADAPKTIAEIEAIANTRTLP